MQTVLSQVDFDTSKLEQQLVVKGSTFEAIKSSSDGVGRHQHKETGNDTGEPAQKYAMKPAEKYLVVTTSAKTRPPVSYYVNADTMSMLMSNISENNQSLEGNHNNNIQVVCHSIIIHY